MTDQSVTKEENREAQAMLASLDYTHNLSYARAHGQEHFDGGIGGSTKMDLKEFAADWNKTHDEKLNVEGKLDQEMLAALRNAYDDRHRDPAFVDEKGVEGGEKPGTLHAATLPEPISRKNISQIEATILHGSKMGGDLLNPALADTVFFLGNDKNGRLEIQTEAGIGTVHHGHGSHGKTHAGDHAASDRPTFEVSDEVKAAVAAATRGIKHPIALQSSSLDAPSASPAAKRGSNANIRTQFLD